MAVDETPPEEYPHEWVDRFGPQAYVPQVYVPQGYLPPTSATQRHYQAVLAIRAFVGLIGAGAAALWALVVFAMLSSAFDTDPATDPHGYGIVFGVLISVPLSLFSALVLPFAAPRNRWGRAFVISLLALVALNALVFSALSLSGAG
ncbi:hypothetical protein [Mycobacterium sp. DL99]|uniref:hypothetical protein n=1 Tax=Mycobacterium sp. DL99 TaxID=2528957 RepID=UPI001082115D|nr:hypothetical protein [Mycobacterium sp. DL99]